mmetsp:Transcript_75038/g.176152  ORF Transcript_75038/g.176152 Transcript_75038/m.176152 type:complete len:292 (-) Transcript_75038:376-1251(-)
MSPHSLRAKRTASVACSSTCSRVMRSFFSMCSSLVAMKVWMRDRAAPARASAAREMSRSLARASEQTVLSLTAAAIAFTASKSPLLDAAKPASMTSTLMRSSWRAMRSFSSRVIDAPGDCSPSRSVVSKMISWSVIARSPLGVGARSAARATGRTAPPASTHARCCHRCRRRGASGRRRGSPGRPPRAHQRRRQWRARGSPAPAPPGPAVRTAPGRRHRSGHCPRPAHGRTSRPAPLRPTASSRRPPAPSSAAARPRPRRHRCRTRARRSRRDRLPSARCPHRPSPVARPG